MSQDRLPSVKERKSYFEKLGGGNTVSPNVCSDHYKTRPYSEAFSDRVLQRIPPPKPKRTFEHTFGPDGKLKNSFGSLSAATRLSSRPVCMATKIPKADEENNNAPGKPRFGSCDVPYYAVSPLPIRRHHSHENLYAVPHGEGDRKQEVPTQESYVKCHGHLQERNPRHHNSLYYASAEINEKLTKQQNVPDRSTLLRKYAFKKQKQKGSKGRFEIAPSKLHATRNVQSDLERRSSRAQLVRRSTLIHKAKVEEFCGQPDPRLFEAAFVIGLRDELDAETGKTKPYPFIKFSFPEKVEKAYSRTAVLFYPDYSHQQKVGSDDYWAGDEEFMVAITEIDGTRRYAYCVRFLPPRSRIEGEEEDVAVYPQVLTVISPIRNSVFYMDLVRNAYAYAKKSDDLLEVFMNSVHRHAYSSKNGWSLKVVEKLSNGFMRHIEIKNYGQTLGKSGCAAIISRITPEVTVCLVAALLGEQRVLIAGNSVGETELIHPMIRPPPGKPTSCSTTRVVQMLEALIRPLSWPHTFIPIVPDNLLELCDNPTPYLMGILRSNLNKVKDLIIEDHEDFDKRQMDFVFVDIDAGVVIPSPEPTPMGANLEMWRYENAVKFCEKMGWSRKMCTSMVKGFREAVLVEPAAAADLKIENVMLKWYAELFGHYRFVGAHQIWNEESKQLLVSGQPNKDNRPFLDYLKETAMFEDWILSRMSLKKADGDASVETSAEEPLPSSEDDLNRRIDKYWLTEFNSLTPRELRRLAQRVTNIFGRLKKL